MYFWQQFSFFTFSFLVIRIHTHTLPIYLIFAHFSLYCIDIYPMHANLFIRYEPFQHSKNLRVMMMMMKAIQTLHGLCVAFHSKLAVYSIFAGKLIATHLQENLIRKCQKKNKKNNENKPFIVDEWREVKIYFTLVGTNLRYNY